MVKNIDQCLSTGHEARNETIYHRKKRRYFSTGNLDAK